VVSRRRAAHRADVVGPVCETGDYLATTATCRASRRRPPRGGTAGAYGAVQAGTYNTRLLVPEVLVDGDRSCRAPASDL
jgi:diaminopimelate decarboxylase